LRAYGDALPLGLPPCGPCRATHHQRLMRSVAALHWWHRKPRWRNSTELTQDGRSSGPSVLTPDAFYSTVSSRGFPLALVRAARHSQGHAPGAQRQTCGDAEGRQEGKAVGAPAGQRGIHTEPFVEHQTKAKPQGGCPPPRLPPDQPSHNGGRDQMSKSVAHRRRHLVLVWHPHTAKGRRPSSVPTSCLTPFGDRCDLAAGSELALSIARPYRLRGLRRILVRVIESLLD